MTVAAASTTAAERRPAPTSTVSRRHLYELDVVRGLTMVGVVGVHTISWTTSSASVAAGDLTILLHFTRESFFTLMAFVLIFSFRQRPVPWRRFWAKRFPFVIVPYVVWTAIYLAITKGSWQLVKGQLEAPVLSRRLSPELPGITYIFCWSPCRSICCSRPSAAGAGNPASPRRPHRSAACCCSWSRCRSHNIGPDTGARRANGCGITEIPWSSAISSSSSSVPSLPATSMRCWVLCATTSVLCGRQSPAHLW